MSETNRLKLPFIMGSQAQKHVTHNEALLLADALMQLAVASRGLSVPPPAPMEGMRYLVAADPSGDWLGQAGLVAAFDAGAWRFHAPGEGWRCWVADEGKLLVHAEGAWSALETEGPEEVRRLGIGTTPDARNRLALKSDAALFTHDDATPGTGDMTVTLNKQAAGRDGGLVFQTGYSSRALLGTFGGDQFQLKVSPDGGTFSPVLFADPGGKLAICGYVDTGAAEPIQLRAGVRITANKTTIEADDAAVSLHLANTRSGGHGGYVLSAGGDGTFSIADRQFGVRLAIGSGGSVEPGADNAASLGTANRRFSAVYAATGVIQTSDARDKVDAEPLSGPKATALLEAIDPVTFRWREPPARDPTSLREPAGPMGDEEPMSRDPRQTGFLAQDVKRALDAEGMDLGVWGLSDPGDGESRQWLRLDQMIPILWASLRQTRQELATLDARSRLADVKTAARDPGS